MIFKKHRETKTGRHMDQSIVMNLTDVTLFILCESSISLICN